MDGPTLPRLEIPGQSPGHTGRPTSWTASALRKLARIYVYTDLGLADGTKIAHHCESSTAPPGRDSANKKLNAMLDLQPRWLRPTVANMAERLQELSNSPTRAVPPPARRQHARMRAVSDLGPNPFGVPDFEPDFSASPSPLKLSPHSAATPVFSGSPFGVSPIIRDESPDQSYEEFCAQAEDPDHEKALQDFLRRTTFMSTGSGTGSFQELLPDKSPLYVQAVRRLVKRFSISTNNYAPQPEHSTEGSNWSSDNTRASIIPGQPDLLPAEVARAGFTQVQPFHDAFSLPHIQRRSPDAGQSDPALSPWFENGYPTHVLQSIIVQGLRGEDLAVRDRTGNTILHVFASNPVIISPSILCQHLAAGHCDSIVNVKNAAGQTFLHVLDASSLDLVSVEQLVAVVGSRNFDFSAKDVHGRTVFHVLMANGVPAQNVQTLLCSFASSTSMTECTKRDAFGVLPFPMTLLNVTGLGISLQGESHASLSSEQQDFTSTGPRPSDGRLRDAILLEAVLKAQDNPRFELDNGWNGLHCLAAAKLSVRSVVDRGGSLSRSGSQRRTGRGDRTPDQQLDSCAEKLQFRHDTANALLLAGVDPNHYDHEGNTPLMAFAAELPEDDDYKLGPSILALLMNNGANVDARNRRGETALHIAVRGGQKLAVRALVHGGANIHVRDSDGRSLLDVADAKIRSVRPSDVRTYAHVEACRAWLSGNGAVQSPSVLQEWGSR